MAELCQPETTDDLVIHGFLHHLLLYWILTGKIVESLREEEESDIAFDTESGIKEVDGVGGHTHGVDIIVEITLRVDGAKFMHEFAHLCSIFPNFLLIHILHICMLEHIPI